MTFTLYQMSLTERSYLRELIRRSSLSSTTTPSAATHSASHCHCLESVSDMWL